MATRGHLGGLVARDARGGAAARRRRAAVDPRRDRRRRPGRGRDRRQGRHDRRRRQPRMGRQRAGEQGRADGDRRRVRDQQGRPQGCRRDPSRPRADARSVRTAGRRLAPTDRRHRRHRRGEGVPSSGRRSIAHRAHAESSGQLAVAPRVPGCARSCARSSPTGCDERAREICTGERWEALTDGCRRARVRPVGGRRHDARLAVSADESRDGRSVRMPG